MHIISSTDAYFEIVNPKYLDGKNSALKALESYELWASGRDALRSVEGIFKKFKRIFLPNYICPALPIFLKNYAEICEYEDSPFLREPKFLKHKPKSGDMVFAINYFGVSSGDFWKNFKEQNAEIFLAEDHTFAPFGTWAKNSCADLSFASLRKFLPIPDGAYLRLKNLSARKTAQRPTQNLPSFAAQILVGMNVKTLLENEPSRKYFMRGEEMLFRKSGAERISEYSFEILKNFNLKKYMRENSENIESFFENIKKLDLPNFLPIKACERISDFAPLLAFETVKERDEARKILTNLKSKPALFWPENLMK